MKQPLAMVSFTTFFGGGEVYLVRLAELIRADFDISAMVASDELAERLHAIGVDAKLLQAKGRLGRMREAARFLKSFAVDQKSGTVLLNGQAEATLVGRCRRLGMRAVVVRHTELRLTQNAIKRWLYRRNAANADAVICVSATIATDHRKFLPHEKLHIIRHWAELRYAATAPKSRPCTVLYVGRLENGKGVAELVEAAERLPHIEFVLVGDGRMRKEIAARGLANLKLAGFQRDLDSFYDACDMLVHPSHSEGSSLVVLEAMAAGVPCLVSDIPALREVAKEGESAALFHCGDVAALTMAITRLCADRERMASQASAARRMISREHSPGLALALYRQTLRGPSVAENVQRQ